MVHFIAAPFHKGQSKEGVKYGPSFVKTISNFHDVFENECTIEVNNYDDKYLASGDFCFNLYKKLLSVKHPWLTVGGDHTISIGTIFSNLKKIEDFGVIWVDAHTDINTPESSITGNIHGQPVSFLMKLHDVSSINGFNWTKNIPKLDTNRIVYIGTRSVDKTELQILKKNNILYFTMNDIRKQGIENIMNKSLRYLDNLNIHLSLDVDSIDPSVFSSTGTKVENGLNHDELRILCTKVSNRLISMDLVEINPDIGDKKQAKKLVKDIVSWCFNTKSKL